MKSIIVRAFALCLACALVASPSASAAPRKAQVQRLTAQQAAKVGETQVVVVFSDLDQDEIDDIQHGTDKFAVGLFGGSVVATGAAATSAASASSAAAAATGAALLPLALFLGFGTFAGIDQVEERDILAASVLSAPVKVAFREQHEAQDLDQRFVDALRVELSHIAWLRPPSSFTKVTLPANGEKDAFETVTEGISADDERALLIVSLRSAVPYSLVGRYVVYDMRFYSRAVTGDVRWKTGKWRKKYQTIDWRREPLFRLQARAAVMTLATADELRKKPAEWIARHEQEVRSRFDAAIDATPDRDGRRELKTLRNAEVERVRGPWLMRQLASHMSERWRGPDGYRYAEVVGPALDQLASALAAEFGKLEPDAPR